MVAFGILLASTVDEEEAEKKKQKLGLLCKANKLHVNHFVYNKSPQLSSDHFSACNDLGNNQTESLNIS